MKKLMLLSLAMIALSCVYASPEKSPPMNKHAVEFAMTPSPILSSIEIVAIAQQASIQTDIRLANEIMTLKVQAYAIDEKVYARPLRSPINFNRQYAKNKKTKTLRPKAKPERSINIRNPEKDAFD